MRKILLLILTLVFPGFALAAGNDVTLSQMQLSVGGVTINVTGTDAGLASITVNSDSFQVLTETGSTLTASTSNRTRLEVDVGAPVLVANVCNGSDSYITLYNTLSGSQRVTVTPTTTVCSDPVTTTSTGGGAAVGGGSSGLSVQQYTATPAVTTPVAVVTPVSQSSSFSSIQFARRLIKGSKGADVTNLQKYLATDSSVYPGGSVTGYFGPATQAAVQKFQEKYGIAKKGIVGYGEVGPATRAKLNSLLSSAGTAAAPVTAPAAVTSSLQDQIAALLLQVAALQAQLAAQAH